MDRTSGRIRGNSDRAACADVALDWHPVLVAVCLQGAVRDEFDLALPIDGDLARIDPAVDARGSQLERARRCGHATTGGSAEVGDEFVRGHVPIIGTPKILSIAVPKPYIGTLIGMATTLGERIKQVREELRLKPAEFAREIGVKQPSLWDLENGETKNPSAETLQRMKERYGVSPDYIMRAPWTEIPRQNRGAVGGADDSGNAA
jgi:DNA-binding XRE family transcriptional regulator